ncbi:MAG: protocatechuate 3,4-dioxygenase subunit beta [Pseudomonadota bacterium]
MSEPAPLRPRDRGWHPPALSPDYRSTTLRAPTRPLVVLEQTLSELTGPVFGHDMLGSLDNDLIRNFARPGAEALGARILIHGQVMDEDGRGVPGALVECWQANAAGRYRHVKDGYTAPLDPNFAGCGRTITDAEGGYLFHSIRPAPYPWPNGPNAWRPAHIHFSLFGPSFAQRLITQMYFEGDPLISLCPIVQSVPVPEAVEALTAKMDMGATRPMDAIAYRFDMVLRGRRATPFENRSEGMR